jgi:SAM-dependent methyltransferase
LCAETRADTHLASGKYSSEGEEYRLVVCGGCGLLYTRPVPGTDELRSLYDEDYAPYYRAERQSKSGPARAFSVKGLTTIFHRTTQWDRRLALRRRRPGRILDIGCGSGDFLFSLKELGWEVYGTDSSPVGYGMAEARGIHAHCGDLAGAHFPDAFFDAVTLWHVLEHVPDPLRQLAEVRRILKDDGTLIVEVPNRDSLTFSLCGEKWSCLDIPRHLQHFTAATLDAVLRKAGFTRVGRRRMHLWDFTIAFYSFFDAFGLRRRLGIDLFSKGFKRALVLSKILFVALGAPLALMCVPYTVVTALLGKGEVLTVISSKSEAIGGQASE